MFYPCHFFHHYFRVACHYLHSGLLIVAITAHTPTITHTLINEFYILFSDQLLQSTALAFFCSNNTRVFLFRTEINPTPYPTLWGNSPPILKHAFYPCIMLIYFKYCREDWAKHFIVCASMTHTVTSAMSFSGVYANTPYSLFKVWLKCHFST